MNTPHPWIFVALAVWVTVGVWAFRLYKRTPSLTKDDFLSNGGPKESFPKSFWYLYLALWAFYWVATIGSMWFIFFIVPFLQSFYIDSNVVTFSSPYAYGFAMSFTMVLTAASLLFVGKLIYTHYPEFDRYQALRNKLTTAAFKKLTWRTQRRKIEEATPKYNEENLARAEWRTVLPIFLFCWSIIVPLYVLAVDDYVLTTTEAVYENGFFSLTASKTLLSEATSARMYATSGSKCHGRGGCSGPYLYPHFELYFQDGSIHDVWGSLGIDFNDQSNLLKVVHQLKSSHIPISVEPLSSYYEGILDDYDVTRQQIVHQIFEEAARP